MVKSNNRSQPGNSHTVIVPDDDAVLGFKALYVLTAGDLVIEDAGGTEVTYPVTPGLFPFGPAKVKTATTADVVGWN